MADLSNLNFNANDVEPNDGFEPLPAGAYTAVICESEWKETKGGTGRMLVLTFEVIDGDYKNRKVWARLNLENPSAQAVEIARGQLSAICRAVGVPAPGDSTELHDRPLVLKVALRKREDTGEMTNEVKGYSPVAAKQPASNGTATPQKPTQQPATTPPWKRGA